MEDNNFLQGNEFIERFKSVKQRNKLKATFLHVSDFEDIKLTKNKPTDSCKIYKSWDSNKSREPLDCGMCMLCSDWSFLVEQKLRKIEESE